MSQPTLQIREYRSEDEQGLIALWQACGLTRPWNDPRLDINRKLEGQPNWLLIGLDDEHVVASVMVGYDGHRGWINYLAVAPGQQKTGIGRMLMQDAESRLHRIGCPKINLQIRGGNTEAIAFYRSIGFEQDDVLSFGKRLINDERS